MAYTFIIIFPKQGQKAYEGKYVRFDLDFLSL